MVPSWFVHGSSIENPQIDGQTMDEPWTNHGGTPYLIYGILSLKPHKNTPFSSTILFF
ncbi:MAG: hypothetical protein N4A37_12150 [Prolixibacteraceae bacterium]|jgi:hypothetical protein|nr:hypothetical protein [Prolixibacteraceae bacterium]